MALIKRSFFLTLRTRQAFEKLALIPRNLYISNDLGGVDVPPCKNLRKTDFSDSTRENGANPEGMWISGGLGKAFRGIGASLLGATMLATAPSTFAKDSPTTPVAQTVATTTYVSTGVPNVPVSERMEESVDGAKLIAASGSKTGILVLALGDNQWMIDELKHAVYDGHVKKYAVKGIALGPSNAEDGFIVYAGGVLIAEAYDIENSDVRGGASYAIAYGQKALETITAKKIEQQANLDF